MSKVWNEKVKKKKKELSERENLLVLAESTVEKGMGGRGR